jgi:Putative prokaryotic signal transducing protein
VADKSQYTVLCRAQGQEIAQVIKSHLESEGIPAVLQYESAGLIYGITVDGIGEVKVLVPKEFLEEARRVIEPQESASPDE